MFTPLRRPDDHEHGPDEPERRTEVVPQIAREREVGRYVHPVQREQREPARHDDLPGELSPLAQSEVALLPDAEIVVDESDDAQATITASRIDARSRVLDALGPVEVGGEVADNRAADDRDATHARRSDLRDVRVRDRPVVANLLPDPPRTEPADEDGRGHDRGDERRRNGEEQRDHARLPQRSRPSRPLATTSSPDGPAGLEQDRVARLHDRAARRQALPMRRRRRCVSARSPPRP